jgi:hypothetical protein
VQSGRPLVVTGPALPDEFDHHSHFKELIDRGAIVLVPRGSADDVYADRIVAALKYPMARTRFDFDGWWNDAAQAVGAVIPARETAPDSADRTPPAGR